MRRLKRNTREYHSFWGSNHYSSQSTRSFKTVDILQYELFKGSYVEVDFEDTLADNFNCFIKGLDNNTIYCFMPKIILYGVGGSVIKSLGNLVFYIKGFGYENLYIKKITDLVDEYFLKYGLSEDIFIYMEYYVSTNQDIEKYGSRIDRSYKIKPSDALKLYFKGIRESVKGIYKHVIEFKPLRVARKFNKTMNNIMIIDLETYVDSQSNLVVYACGYKYNNHKPVTFYKSDYMNSNEMIRAFLKEIIRVAENNTTIYAHNFGKFDGVFLLKHILELFRNEYDIEPVISDNIIKQILLTEKVKPKKLIRFHDSYLMLPSGLKKLCDAFNIEEGKGIFPHEFVSEDKINYSGGKPSIKYYSNITIEEYNLIKPHSWNLRDECIKYLIRDLESLMSVIIKFRDLVYNKYSLDICKHITIPSLALKIYRTFYYKNHYKVKIIDGNVYKDIKRGFFGGKTEVYKPLGDNLKYYDINSLYPKAMLNPMPVGNPELIYYDIPRDLKELKDLFGFAEAEIEAPRISRPILPVRLGGRIYNPIGKWRGMYFIEELRSAMKAGYKVKIIYAYNFEKGYDIFKEYIDYNYAMKSSTSGVLKQMYKLLLNSLFGRFGMLPSNDKSILINTEELGIYEKIYDIVSVQKINDRLLLLTINPALLSVISDGTDIGEKRTKPVKNIQSLPIAAAITAYARILMNKYIIDPKLEVYYTDTDSLVVDKNLPRSSVSPTVLGKMKLEYKISKGMFILPKVYYLKCIDGKEIVKFKGIKDLKDKSIYERMIYGESKRELNLKEIRLFRDLWGVNGIKQVNLESRYKMNLNSRKMIFRDNIWVGTRPYSYKELCEGMKDNKKI